jgi:hypothetical protein
MMGPFRDAPSVNKIFQTILFDGITAGLVAELFVAIRLLPAPLMLA